MRELLCLLLLLNVSNCTKIYQPTFLSEDELNHVRSERQSGQGTAPCDEDNLINLLAEIQVINPESILKLGTYTEIDDVCAKVDDSLRRMKDYLRNCQPPNQPDLYRQLIKGVESLCSKLCSDSPFKKKFQDIHSCLHELRNDLEDCAGPADWNENYDNDFVCKAYKEITDCYYIKTAKVCGNEAAEITKEFIESVIDSILTISCDNIKQNPVVKDPMPSQYLKKSKNLGEIPQVSLLLTTTIMFIQIFK